MSTATEQNFPEGSAVLITDDGSKYGNKYGIVDGYSGQFGVKVRLKSGIIPTIDSSRLRVLEEEDAEETTQGDVPETSDDPKVAEEAKTTLSSKLAGYAKHALVSSLQVIAIMSAIVVVSLYANRGEPEPATAPKTEKELAVERINARNLKIAPVSDACITLKELKTANEADLSILFPSE